MRVFVYFIKLRQWGRWRGYLYWTLVLSVFASRVCYYWFIVWWWEWAIPFCSCVFFIIRLGVDVDEPVFTSIWLVASCYICLSWMLNYLGKWFVILVVGLIYLWRGSCTQVVRFKYGLVQLFVWWQFKREGGGRPIAHLPTPYRWGRGAGLRFGATGASAEPTGRVGT